MWREIALSLMSAIASLILYHTYGKIRIIHAVYGELQYLIKVVDGWLEKGGPIFKEMIKLESLRRLMEDYYPTFHKIDDESGGALSKLLYKAEAVKNMTHLIQEIKYTIVHNVAEGEITIPTQSVGEDRLSEIKELANKAINALEKHKLQYFLFI